MALAHTSRYELGGVPPPRLVVNEIDLSIAFGRRVAQRRLILGLSQDAMIKQLNHLGGGEHGRSSASVWENGHAIPSVMTIYVLARVLKTTPEYLAYGTPSSDPKNGTFMVPPSPKTGELGSPFTGKSRSLTVPRPFYNRKSYRRGR